MIRGGTPVHFYVNRWPRRTSCGISLVGQAHVITETRAAVTCKACRNTLQFHSPHRVGLPALTKEETRA